MRYLYFFLLSLSLFTLPQQSLAQNIKDTKKLKIVTSIAPIYALMLNVSQNTDEVYLLLRPNISPHHFHLKPSQVKWLQQSDAIFYIDPNFETPLAKLLTSKQMQSKKIIALADTVNDKLLMARGQHKENQNHRHEHGHHHDHEKEHEHEHHKCKCCQIGLHDYHIWLDPHLAIDIAKTIAKTLSELNPQAADIYHKNTENLISNLQSLIKKTQLSHIKNNPYPAYMVYHDAYQYFEKAFGLPEAHIFKDIPHETLSGHKLKKARHAIAEHRISCIFYEPQFPQKILSHLQKEFNTQLIEVDPLGQNIKLDENFYFNLITQINNSFATCVR